MRLLLLPISTRRTLIYCQRHAAAPSDKQGWLDKGTSKAASIWSGWEKKDSGWQKKVVEYGNTALRRIPYEEWGLKSIPPFSARNKADDLSGNKLVEVEFPSSLIDEKEIPAILRKLGTERQSLHRSRLIYCCIGMPISAPFALVPVIPNIPFFYLVFRAYSHWKAWKGSQHLEFLVNQKLIKPRPSPILTEVYASGKLEFDPSSLPKPEKQPTNAEDVNGEMILHLSDGKRIAEALEIPELDVELDRAVWQVEKAIKAAQELKEEKTDLKDANSMPKEKK